MRSVLVTGVSRRLSAQVAQALASDPKRSVIGVDMVPPHPDLGAAGFLRADIRNPVIGRILADHKCDTVVHMALGAGVGSSRSAMKEMNVIGTMQLLAACQHAESVRTLVVQSSSSVYGASWQDPARFTEDMSAKSVPRSGFGKDAIEIESYVRGVARRRPDMTVVTLRLAPLLGAAADSHVTRLFTSPFVPQIMGFDPRLQFLHPQDAVRALAVAASEPVAGTFNVAAADVVTLKQALRILGRPWLPVPRRLAPTAAVALRRSGLSDFTVDQLDALTYGQAIDITRFGNAYGFTPQWTTRAAVAELASAVSPGRSRLVGARA